MPIYTYACEACGSHYERRQGFLDPPLTACESCGGALRKVMHPVGVIFKGTGFYNTDYRKTVSGDGSSSPKDTPADKGQDGSSAEPKSAEPTTADSGKSEKSSDQSARQTKTTDKTPAATAKD